MDLSHAARPATSEGTGRIEALSDGVFAVAMTLLVVTFDVMKLPSELSDQQLRDELWNQWPDLLHYFESFIVVAAFWMQHHSQFHVIRRSDWSLRWLNVLALMTVVLIPITNLIVGDYGHLAAAAMLFEGNMLVAGVLFWAIWAHAARAQLVDEALPAAAVAQFSRRNLVIPLVSVGAIGLAFLWPRWSTLLYFLVPLLVRLAGRRPPAAARSE